MVFFSYLMLIHTHRKVNTSHLFDVFAVSVGIPGPMPQADVCEPFWQALYIKKIIMCFLFCVVSVYLFILNNVLGLTHTHWNTHSLNDIGSKILHFCVKCFKSLIMPCLYKIASLVKKKKLHFQSKSQLFNSDQGHKTYSRLVCPFV